ncbi:hypothetical protein ACFCXH_00030 [Streptomyces nojiriensis]|uniref:hypothetical protein n=1 Tax=Streptomyces nojiriensis TaxID=66374 RepID=UPI0035DA5F6D
MIRSVGGNVGEGGVLVEWDWWTVDFGDAHAGAVGVLVGGGEPGPVYFDVGSGSDVPSTSHWSAYDGRYRRPRAEALRAVCACGWRGAAEYPLDWATVGDRPLYEADVDLTGRLAGWAAHLSVVREGAQSETNAICADLERQGWTLNPNGDRPDASRSYERGGRYRLVSTRGKTLALCTTFALTDSQTCLTLAGLRLNLSDIPLPGVTVHIG